MHAQFPGPPRSASHVRFTQALPVGEGMAFLGHYDQDDVELRVLNLLFDDGRDIRLPLDRGDVDLIRTPHPARDLHAGSSLPAGRGFVIRVPARALRGMQPMLSLNDQIAELERVPLGDVAKFITQPALLAAYGHALDALAKRHGDKALARALSEPLAQQAGQRVTAMLGAVDETWLCGKHLLVIGRWHCEPGQLASVQLQAGANEGSAKAKVDVTAAIHSTPLAPRGARGSLLRATSSGFVLLRELASLAKADTLNLHVTTHGLGT
ncbi:MAG: hypothetical protein SXG53_28690, partial [Pseudomonadota bacterium]|nr:hypothetical protein [Pseudomonadota bacterium]